MAARPERVVTQAGPITQAGSVLRACVERSSDPSASGHSYDDSSPALVLLSDEAAASEAAPLISHNALKLAFCGGASGALAKTCTAPLARMTILYQVRCASCNLNLTSALTVACCTTRVAVLTCTST